MTEQPQQNKLEHPCFPQPADGSVRVWRYLDLTKFIWLLENQKLYMSPWIYWMTRMKALRKISCRTVESGAFSVFAGARKQSLLQEFGDELGNENFLQQSPE